MIKELVKLANHLDSKGLAKEADYLDGIIRRAKPNASHETPKAFGKAPDESHETNSGKYHAWYYDTYTMIETPNGDRYNKGWGLGTASNPISHSGLESNIGTEVYDAIMMHQKSGSWPDPGYTKV